MNFELTKEQALLKKAAQQFAENTLEPTAAELDETHVFPVENFKQMARYGFTGIGVPKEYGGVGGGMTEEVIAVSEFAKKCMASAATCPSTSSHPRPSPSTAPRPRSRSTCPA